MKNYLDAATALVSAALIVGGWLFTKYKDREQEKFKIGHSRREAMVKAFLALDETIGRTSGRVDQDPGFLKQWMELTSLMQLYGSKSEYESLTTFAESFFGPNRSIEAANVARSQLRQTLTTSIRNELGFGPL